MVQTLQLVLAAHVCQYMLLLSVLVRTINTAAVELHSNTYSYKCTVLNAKAVAASTVTDCVRGLQFSRWH